MKQSAAATSVEATPVSYSSSTSGRVKNQGTTVSLAAGIVIGLAIVLFVRGGLGISLDNGAASAGVLLEQPATTPAPESADDIHVDPAMIQNLGVRSVAAKQRVMTEPIRTTGYVDYDPEHVVNINARISGWVEKLYVDYVGQQVRRGQPLLEVYSPALTLTEEDFLRSRRLAAQTPRAAEAQYDGRELMMAAESRLSLMGVSAPEVKRLELTGRVPESVPLESIATGVVTQIKVVDGAHIKAGEDLYTIADLSRVWVYADVDERDLRKVSIGQKAEVSSAALGGRVLRGEVSYIYPNVDAQTRTVRVRLEFVNREGLLKPGIYVKTTLLDESGEKMLAVPTEAVINSGIRYIVIVDKGAGHFEPREIRIGTESNGFYPVLSGLDQGERVVTSAQFLIDSESNLHEVLAAMTLQSHPNSYEQTERARDRR